MDQETIRRRHLPHWDVPGAVYFVTTCLQGSIPAQGLLDIARNRKNLQGRSIPVGVTTEDWQLRCWKQNFVRVENWLDHTAANRILEQPELAQIVVNAMFHFAEERYDLYSFAVMPSHIHWLFEPRPAWIETLEDMRRSPRERIVYSLNRFTSNQCNKILGKKGEFWQDESYDHWVRDVDELERIIRYIEENAVKAGLAQVPEDWPYSSAHYRKVRGLEWGSKLPKPAVPNFVG